MKSKKVAFIQPEVGFKPYSALGTRPLGILYLASALKRDRQDYDIQCFDEDSRPVLKNAEINEKFLLEADFIGISGLTSTINRAYSLADKLRDLRSQGKTNPNLHIALGGIHATFCPDEAINHSDVVLRGEGEEVITELVDGKPKGIVRGEKSDLDKLADPDYSLLHYKKKRLTDYVYGNLASVQLSRGCSFNCDFCSVRGMFGPPRNENPEKSFYKIENLVKQGFRRGFFHDDNFSDVKPYRDELFDRLIRAGLKFNYIVQDRIDALQEEGYVEKMARSGCTMVMFALESPNEEFLKSHNKELDLDKVERGVKLLRKNRIVPYAFCMIEPENSEMTKHTIKLLRELKIKYAQFTILTPFPGSVLYQQAKDKIHAKWEYFNGLTWVTENKEKAREAGKHLSETWREFYSPIRASFDLLKFQFPRAALRLYGWNVGRKIMKIQP